MRLMKCEWESLSGAGTENVAAQECKRETHIESDARHFQSLSLDVGHSILSRDIERSNCRI